MKIIEHFISIQGEGVRSGRPSLFIRVAGCNLRCVFRNPKGKVASICDTYYASFENPEIDETEEESLASVYALLSQNPGVADVVVTGGEPLLNQKDLYDLLTEIKKIKPELVTTVETNGTIDPNPELYKVVDLWSVSPKLSTSVPNEKDMKKYGLTEAQCKYHAEKRINVDALANIIIYGNDAQLKFVYSGEDCINEIQDIKSRIQTKIDEADYDEDVNHYIMLMPEGITNDAILGKSDEVVKVCINNGWAYTTRLHILIWGNVKEK